jgi:hypothetical protein
VLPSADEDHFVNLVRKEKAKILIGIADSLRGNLREAALMLFEGYETKNIGDRLGVSASRAGMIVSTLRERVIMKIIELGHVDLFSEELTQLQPGLRPGKVRKRRRRPRMATLLV